MHKEVFRKRFRPEIEDCKPHWGGATAVSAYISAAIAAASIAAQQSQQAAAKRSQQNAAQAAKQGMATGGSTNSVAGTALGALGQNGGAIKDMLVPKRAQPGTPSPDVAGDTASSLSAPPPPVDLGQSGGSAAMGGRGGAMGQGMQQAFGGQQPDLQQLLQQLQASGGMNIG